MFVKKNNIITAETLYDYLISIESVILKGLHTRLKTITPSRIIICGVIVEK